MPTTLIGTLHPSNKDTIAWNEHGIIAFGCHSTLVCLDARSLNVFQTLEHHSSAINLICWRPEPSLIRTPDLQLKCASSDISGHIVVWDVLAGTVFATFKHSNSTVQDLKWPKWQDSTRDFLLALHSNNTFILWNAGTGEKVWEYKVPHNVFKFTLDPFDSSRLALASIDSTIVFMGDLFVHKPPEGPPVLMTLRQQSDARTSVRESNAIFQLQYHSAYENLLFALFSNEIFCVEVQAKQVIYSVIVDAGSPLTQILTCSSRDAFFLAHQSGLVSFRVAKVQLSDERMQARLVYERACFTEPQRSSARCRMMGAALCPVTQCSIALMFNSGRIIIYQLKDRKHLCVDPYRVRSLADGIRLSPELENIYSDLRLYQYGMYSPLCSSVTAVRMRPLEPPPGDAPLSENGTPTPTSNLDEIVHLAAIGTSMGVIHLVNVFSGKIERDLQVHACPVKCLEWGGPNVIISAAYSASLSSSATVRNDIFATDIRTGIKRRIRPETEESPVELIRVSFYQCYLAISFRNEPLEIWELKSMRLLRRMSKRCPIIVDMAWSGKHHNVKAVSEKTQIFRENLVVLDNDNHLYHVVVKGLHVRDGKEVSTQWKSGATMLRCMVWKDDLLAFGDSAGRLGVWDLVRSQCRQSGLSQSTRGPVLRCVFSRLTGDYSLAVQHPTSIVLWDTEKLQPIQSFQRSGLSIIDVDMCGLTPVFIASDGMFRFAASDKGNNQNLPVASYDNPLLLRGDYLNALERFVKGLSGAEIGPPEEANQKALLLAQDPDFEYICARLSECSSPLEQLAFIFNFMGQIALAQFCQVVEAAAVINGKKTGENLIEHGHSLKQMAANLQLFWTSELYSKRAESLTRVMLSSCKSEKQVEQAIEKCVIMKKNDLATYSLLNNDQSLTNAADVRLNALKACLLSSSFPSEEAKCLVKMTATNLIASNFVSDGIQLLFLIDQAFDACKYLISQGRWKQGVAYSKMSPKCDSAELLAKYAEHLANDQMSHKSLALMILASLGHWDRCRQMLAQCTTLDAVARERLEMVLNCAVEPAARTEVPTP